MRKTSSSLALVTVTTMLFSAIPFPGMAAEELPRFEIRRSFVAKKYLEVIRLGDQWLKENPDDQQIREIVGQAYYVTKDHKNAAGAMKDLVTAAERSGQIPKEGWLQVILSSSLQSKDRAGTQDALRQLLKYHPKPSYWETMLKSMLVEKHPQPVTLGIYRLMYDLDLVKRSEDFTEMAQLAMQTGCPGDAQRVLEKGLASNIFTNADRPRYERLLATAKQQADADRAWLAQAAGKAKSGRDEIVIGLGYLSYREFSKAIAALESGLKKGGIRNEPEARIALGIAHLKSGRRQNAREAFKSVSGDASWVELAELWFFRS